MPSPGGPPGLGPDSDTHAGADVVLNNLFPTADPTPHLGENLDGFAPLSNFLLDPQYMDMDRIISFQDSFM